MNRVREPDRQQWPGSRVRSYFSQNRQSLLFACHWRGNFAVQRPIGRGIRLCMPVAYIIVRSKPRPKPAQAESRQQFRAVAEPEVEDLLDEGLVLHAGGLGAVGEVFVGGDLRVGVGFEQVELALGRQAEVEPRVAGQAEVTVDALAEVGDLLLQLRGPGPRRRGW